MTHTDLSIAAPLAALSPFFRADRLCCWALNRSTCGACWQSFVTVAGVVCLVTVSRAKHARGLHHERHPRADQQIAFDFCDLKQTAICPKS